MSTIKPKKSLGQHFLTDNNIISKVISAVRESSASVILEIGPGEGALTKHLADLSKRVIAVEVDGRAVEYLNKTLPDVEVIHKDFLKLDLNQFLNPAEPVLIVGNLPYYITSPILFHAIEYRACFSSAIFMMQKEVASRLVAKPRTKDYGILSVQTQLFSRPEILFHVAPGSFFPPPKVDSSVVRLRFDAPALACSDTSLKKLVRTAFNQRRKMLSNSLKVILNEAKPEGFDLSQRPEEWEPRIYEKLAVYLQERGILA